MRRATLKLFLCLGLWAASMAQSAVRSAETEADLIAILQSDASAVRKSEACRQLRLVGTPRSVPALAGLLTDERVGHAARHALEGLALPAADAALRDALGKTTGPLRAGLADSLGWRADGTAVPVLRPLLADPDATVAAAAASALGRIGGPDALAALDAASPGPASALRTAVNEAVLRCADQLLAAGRVTEARGIYERLVKADAPDQFRVAAHLGLFRCAGPELAAQVKSAFRGGEPAAELAALQMAGELRVPQATAVVTELLPTARPELQVGLLALLRAGGDASALPSVVAAGRSSHPAVRRAAWEALGELGDASVVPLLTEAAAVREGDEQKAARQALATLRRGEVTVAMLTALSTATPAEQAELVRTLTVRDEREAVPALLELARTGRSAVRAAAWRALGSLVDGSQAGALVPLLAGASDAETRDEVVGVFASLAERAPNAEGLDVGPIVSGVAAGDLVTRQSLLRVCALFVAAPFQGAFRSALNDPDERIRSAAARALCATRDPGLLPDLLAVTRQTADARLRSMTLEGVVRLATDEGEGLSAAQRTEALSAAFELATRVEDKRQVLAGLGRVPNMTTLKLAERATTDPDVRAEANAARLQIAKRVGLSAAFINTWQVCGPYRQRGIVGAPALFDVPFGPEKAGEKVEWQTLPRAAHVNLAAFFPGQENCVAYLRTAFTVPDAVDAVLLLGSDDGVKAWLNGALVHANNVDRGDVADQDQAAARLIRGTNTLMLKITQGGGGWSARARVAGRDGQPVAGLQAVLPDAAATGPGRSALIPR